MVEYTRQGICQVANPEYSTILGKRPRTSDPGLNRSTRLDNRPAMEIRHHRDDDELMEADGYRWNT